MTADSTRTNVVMAVVLIVVLAAAGASVWLLVRTADAANDVADKSGRIAMNGRGINIATDAVVQLRRTNRIARGILRSVRPLDEQLVTIVRRARSIDTSARKIDATAGAINQTAGQANDAAAAIDDTAGTIKSVATSIDATAGRINSTAGRIESVSHAIRGTSARVDSVASDIDDRAETIVDIARQIDDDVRLINVNLADSIAIAAGIEHDTSDIVRQALEAHQTAACVERRLNLLGLLRERDGHCQNPPRTGSDGG